MPHLIIPLLAAAAASVLSAAAASADLGDQLFKLLPKDGAAGDLFGTSVAISGTIGKEVAIVGAWRDDDNGLDSGSAYLFDISEPANPTQVFKLLADDGAADDRFGISVAICGPPGNEVAIVGASGDDDNGNSSGSAYLFDTTTGRQIAKLLPDDGAAADNFGNSVAISGTTAIVGARNDDDNGSFSGSAYLFDTTTGAQIAKLLPDDNAFNDFFGTSVAISGTTAIVGAPGDDDNGNISGSAYLFDITTHQQLCKLVPNDGATGDWFGISVAISGDIAIVGSYQDDDNGTNSGSAYLFDTTTGRQIAKLLPNDGAAGDDFGLSVGISGATAIVGARWDDDNGSFSGSAYLFDTAMARQIAKLLPNDGAVGDEFGYSVAINGVPGKETGIVGAWLDDDNGSLSGSAYLFDASFCPWDLDGNGVVGASDLLALLVSWGPCKDCPADFDGDGSVGASDLLALLANWGPCP
ncbi:MAG: FG-GAP repeat protein [Phycisphaerales bacterium]